VNDWAIAGLIFSGAVLYAVWPFMSAVTERLKDVLMFAWCIFIMAVMYLAIAFLCGAFVAMLAGADWVAAGWANVRDHIHM